MLDLDLLLIVLLIYDETVLDYKLVDARNKKGVNHQLDS